MGQAFQPAINLSELRSFAREDLQAVVLFRRKLPHWELAGSTSCHFPSHKSSWTTFWRTTLACGVEEALWFSHGERYCLHAYVIVPDHVHLLLTPVAEWSLAKILQGLKGFTARQMNRCLGRKVIFWQNENFDHLVRNELDWLDKFTYIHDNRVEAGLSNRPRIIRSAVW